jgi:hypothetical protein
VPLPVINDTITHISPPNLGSEPLNHPPVTGGNEQHKAKRGNAQWVGRRLVISGEGLINYHYLPAVQDKISFCVVNARGSGEAYVISDQFGGCEFHELYNATFGQLAFLHVYRGAGGQTTSYTAAQGWVLRNVSRSEVITNISINAAAMGTNWGSNWMVACINRSGAQPVVEREFINVIGGPNVTVRFENKGNAPYRPARPPRAASG